MRLMTWIAYGSAVLWLGLLIFGWMLGRRWKLPLGLVYVQVVVGGLKWCATFFDRFHLSAVMFLNNWQEMRDAAEPGTEKEDQAEAVVARLEEDFQRSGGNRWSAI